MKMGSDQYEELCRFFIADKVGVEPDEIESLTIPNPKRPGLESYKHQIDLYWETSDEISRYINIANSKWRSSAKIKQGEVSLLQQVRQKVAAHKAFMITNIGFTSGAKAVAKDEGIALHVVRPNFDVAVLPKSNRPAIREKLLVLSEDLSKPVYFHEIIHRALDFADLAGSHQPPGSGSVPTGYNTRVISPPAIRVARNTTNRATSGGTHRVDPGGGSNRSGGLGQRGFIKK